MTTTETASLILTLLAHDDACTARELAAVIGTTTAKLRPALRQLVESGDVVTSGRAGATRYVLAVVEQVAAPAQPVALEVSPAVQQQRAERSSTASLVLADETPVAPPPVRKPRAVRPVIPATVDLEGALQATQQRLESGATLAELSARPAPPRIVIAELAAEVDALVPAAVPAPVAHRDVKPENVLRRECATPTEDVAARKLALQQQEAAGDAHDRATARRESRQHLAMGVVSALMVLAPIAWVVAHLVR